MADAGSAGALDGRCRALLQAVLDKGDLALIGVDAAGHTVFLNRQASNLLGLAPVPVGIDAAAHADGPVATALQGFALCLRDGRTVRPEVEIVAGGHRLITLVVAGAGVPPGRTDALTGLADRQWFHDRLDASLPGDVAVLMLDLDRFKAVNDMHGHPVGDALLQKVGQRLRSAVRESDVIARLGGDEFGIVMSASGPADATAARLVDLLSRPYLIGGVVANISVSIGIAIGPQDGMDTTSLVRAADLALYQAKNEGRRLVRRFTPELDMQARARHALLDDLRRALPLDQFVLHYQPQVNLASNELIGFEALVRWIHPERGLIPPDQFIPLAEEMSLIASIGEWVLRTACFEAASWPGNLTVAVNVSPKQLADRERLPCAVRAALAASGLPPAQLEVEITESALVSHEGAALHVLHALHGLGVRVSMDDFGTGYSSLSQLRSFPFDKLKIDRSFVRDMAGSHEAVAVVRAIAALGTSLGMTTTAEGVETDAQLEGIRDHGCTDMQGYLVSRPVPGHEIGALIERLRPVLEPAT